jgi:hypothetical protein
MLKVKSTDNRCPHGIYVVLGFFGAVYTFRAAEEMLLQWGQFRLILDHSKVIAFKVVV